ncbi:MAG: hypothetical protein ACP5NY_03390 [Thermocladium sp.]
MSSPGALSNEEKKRLLKAIQEDEEFRYAVAGLLGLDTILNDLRRLREEFDKYIEKLDKYINSTTTAFSENDKKWEMNFKRWEENDKKWEEAMKRFSRIELELGASVESQYSRYVLEDLRDEVRARGETVEQRARNIDLDGVEIDLLLTTDKAAYVVEVKVRPTINDVGALLAKVDVVQRNLNKPTVPILTGSYIGGEVEAYAKGKGVKIYRY